MGFWKRSKKEIKRVLTLDLHSYWEVFYVDFIFLLSSFILAFPFSFILHLFGVGAPFGRFMNEHIEKPMETNIVKMITPSGLSEKTYWMITYALILFIEMVFIHLMVCRAYRQRKLSRELEINRSSDEECDLILPQYTEKDCSDKEKKVSICTRIGDELTRLFRLDLHSHWEVFYLDVIFVITTFILAIPFDFIVEYFRLEKIYFPVEYIENSLETSIVRPIASSDLDDSTYKLITLIGMLVFEIALFHGMATLFYRFKTSSDKTSDVDVDKTSGCFSRSRISPSGEKERSLKTIYESVYTISSSSLFPMESTEKLIDKTAFP